MRFGFSISICVLVACGGSSTPKPDAAVDIGFNKPTASLHANTEVSDHNWMDLGPADLTCLGTPSSDEATTVAVTLNGIVKDFQSGSAVPQTTVTVFQGIDYMHPFDTQMSDAMGFATFTVPTGVKRFGFKMTSSTSLPTFLLNQLIKPSDAVQPTGTCDPAPCRMSVQSVSTSTGQLLPAHHNQQEASSADGLFMVIQLPASDTAFVQMWGYPTDADMAADSLKLIAELQVPVLADTVITGSYSPLRQ